MRSYAGGFLGLWVLALVACSGSGGSDPGEDTAELDVVDEDIDTVDDDADTVDDDADTVDDDADTIDDDADTVDDDADTVDDDADTVDDDADTVHDDADTIDDDTAEDTVDDDADTGAEGTRWLRTEGNRILRSDGSVWRGRGMNIHDTRGCNNCTYNAPNRDAVLHRANAAIDWGSNFIRLCLESYASADDGHGGTRQHWLGILDDAAYFADVVHIVETLTEDPEIYVLVSLWHDASLNAQGWPTEATAPVLEALTRAFAHNPQVIFGVSNEPQENYSGAQDAEVWEAMNAMVQAIRDVEAEEGVSQHLVTVQGTRSWGRWLTYYIDHPITAGGGTNVVYETHAYNGQADWDALIDTPHQTLPVIVGEYAPDGTYMLWDDAVAFPAYVRERDIPHLAWTLHQACPPNIVSNGAGCAIVDLELTEWGEVVVESLGEDW